MTSLVSIWIYSYNWIHQTKTISHFSVNIPIGPPETPNKNTSTPPESVTPQTSIIRHRITRTKPKRKQQTATTTFHLHTPPEERAQPNSDPYYTLTKNAGCQTVPPACVTGHHLCVGVQLTACRGAHARRGPSRLGASALACSQYRAGTRRASMARRHDPGGAQPPHEPPAPSSPASAARLRDRVTFFERVWTGDSGTPPDVPDAALSSNFDVSDIERRLREDHKRKAASSTKIEVKLKPTPQSPVRRSNDEIDVTTGAKLVKFEKIVYKKSVEEITSVKPVVTTSVRVETLSRTPSDERTIYDDSAYQSQGAAAASSSKASSVTGRFPSEETLSGRSHQQSQQQHVFQNMAARMEFVRSKSEYDSHIAEIRGSFRYHILIVDKEVLYCIVFRVGFNRRCGGRWSVNKQVVL